MYPINNPPSFVILCDLLFNQLINNISFLVDKFISCELSSHLSRSVRTTEILRLSLDYTFSGVDVIGI